MKKFGMGILSVSIIALAACGDDTPDENGASEDLESNGGGTISVGVANEEPYGYLDDGIATGAAAEIARAVFQEMGYDDIEGNVVDFTALIPSLNAGQFDVVTAGMDIRPERCSNASFGDIEIQYGEGMAVAAGNPHNLQSYEDLVENEDLTVSVMQAANQIDMLTSLGMDSSRIQEANSIADNFAALEAGDVDAVVATDATINQAMNTANSELVETPDSFNQPVIDGVEQIAYGAAVFRDNDEGNALREEYNEALANLIDSGAVLEILEEFGFTEDNLPPEDITTADRCEE